MKFLFTQPLLDYNIKRIKRLSKQQKELTLIQRQHPRITDIQPGNHSQRFREARRKPQARIKSPIFRFNMTTSDEERQQHIEIVIEEGLAFKEVRASASLPSECAVAPMRL